MEARSQAIATRTTRRRYDSREHRSSYRTARKPVTVTSGWFSLLHLLVLFSISIPRVAFARTTAAVDNTGPTASGDAAGEGGTGRSGAGNGTGSGKSSHPNIMAYHMAHMISNLLQNPSFEAPTFPTQPPHWRAWGRVAHICPASSPPPASLAEAAEVAATTAPFHGTCALEIAGCDAGNAGKGGSGKRGCSWGALDAPNASPGVALPPPPARSPHLVTTGAAFFPAPQQLILKDPSAGLCASRSFLTAFTFSATRAPFRASADDGGSSAGAGGAGPAEGLEKAAGKGPRAGKVAGGGGALGGVGGRGGAGRVAGPGGGGFHALIGGFAFVISGQPTAGGGGPALGFGHACAPAVADGEFLAGEGGDAESETSTSSSSRSSSSSGWVDSSGTDLALTACQHGVVITFASWQDNPEEQAAAAGTALKAPPREYVGVRVGSTMKSLVASNAAFVLPPPANPAAASSAATEPAAAAAAAGAGSSSSIRLVDGSSHNVWVEHCASSHTLSVSFTRPRATAHQCPLAFEAEQQREWERRQGRQVQHSRILTVQLDLCDALGGYDRWGGGGRGSRSGSGARLGQEVDEEPVFVGFTGSGRGVEYVVSKWSFRGALLLDAC
ncbi:unnamed protein product [Closterium sp. NIES-54]